MFIFRFLWKLIKWTIVITFAIVILVGIFVTNTDEYKASQIEDRIEKCHATAGVEN